MGRVETTGKFARHRIFGFLFAIVAWAATSALGDGIVITEIHYDPELPTVREEFVEVHNTLAEPVDLSGWFFSAGIDFTFPDGTTIPAGGFLVIAEDPAVLENRLGVVGAIGPFTGRLSNGGERLALRNAGGDLEDVVDYGSRFPWPSAAHGDGSSMELIHPDLDNDLAGNWRASGFVVGAVPAERVPVLDAEDTGWRYRKGTSEASDPPGAWRELDFAMDETWLTGQTSVGFGDDDDNTVLEDMLDNYTSVYLRKTFEWPAGEELPSFLKLGVYADDGAIYWINGVEVQRVRVTDGEIPFDGRARSGEARWTEVFLPNPAGYLRPGTNVLAIHALNVRASSNDFSIDATLFVPGVQDFDGAGDFASPPTPGAQNTVFSLKAPPAIRQVEHSPKEPTSDDSVLVTAKITDPDGVVAVSLEYQIVAPGSYVRLSDPEYATDWTEVAMLDDGQGVDAVADDGVFSVVLPREMHRHRNLVRYRLSATDRDGFSAAVPYADDAQPNFAYFVYDGVPGWRGASRPGSTPVLEFSSGAMTLLPAYHLIATATDVNNCQYVSTFENRHFLGTMVYEGNVYDHIEFEIRGEFSTYVSGKNKWRFHFRRGHEFRPRDDYGERYRERWRRMNLSAAATPWVPTNRGMAALGEAVAFRSYELAGVPSPKNHYLQFRVIDEAVEAHGTDQYRGDLWGLYMTIEHTDGAFLDERRLPNGNTYKIEGGNGDKRNQGPTQPLGSSDYNALKSGYNSRQSVDWWRSNVELDVYFSFRAVNRAVNNMDLREGWNICMYHDPVTNLWSVIPWDLDMLYMPVTHWSGVMNFQNALSQHAVFALEYRNRARELEDLLFSEEPFGKLVDQIAAFSNPPDEPLTFVDVDQAMWNHHPRTAGSHRGAFYRNPSTHSARGGTIRRELVSADHEGMAQWVKDFALTGYGQNQLRASSRDNSIPETPTVEATGDGAFSDR